MPSCDLRPSAGRGLSPLVDGFNSHTLPAARSSAMSSVPHGVQAMPSSEPQSLRCTSIFVVPVTRSVTLTPVFVLRPSSCVWR